MARIQQSIEINVPVHAAYSQLTQFEEYPRFMEGVDEVRRIDGGHLRWHTRMSDRDVEWDAEITEQVPDRCIAWRNISGPKNVGRIELRPRDGDRTELMFSMDVEAREQPPGPEQGNPLDAVARRAEEDLARLKRFMESRGTDAGERHAVRTDAGDQVHDQGQEHPHFGYAGEEVAKEDGEAGASYAAGAEGWDGNEDPGVAISAGLQNDDAQPAGNPAPPQQQDGIRGGQTPVSLSRAEGTEGMEQEDAPPPVAAEQSFDQQSDQARQVGRMPDAAPVPGQPSPAEAVAQSMKPGQRQGQDAAQGMAQQQGAQGAQMPQQTAPSWLPNFMQAWEDPFSMMRRMSEEMDQIIEKFVGRPLSAAKAGGAVQRGAWTPPLEITQRGDQLIVSAELPGVRREDVQVEIRNDRLIIEGDRHEQSQAGQQGYRRTERSYGHFYRVISLPERVDADGASAALRDGMLEISLPVLRDGVQGRRLDIRAPE